MILADKCSRELVSFYNSGRRAGERILPEYDIPVQVKKLEVDLIVKALRKTGGNKSKAAGLLNITRQGLLKKMKRYGVGQND